MIEISKKFRKSFWKLLRGSWSIPKAREWDFGQEMAVNEASTAWAISRFFLANWDEVINHFFLNYLLM